jgi:ATP-dependent DNA ligase
LLDPGARQGVDHTIRFADLAQAISKLSARTLVLDGEVAIYDQQLRSRFDWLREPDPDAVATPPLFMAFDLLYCDRRDLTARLLRDRRAQLEDVVAGNELVFPVRWLAPDDLSQSPDRPGGRGAGLETQTHRWATVTPSPCRW